MSQKTLERLEYLEQGNLESLVRGKRACQVRRGAAGNVPGIG
jgi:hypothetical protein